MGDEWEGGDWGYGNETWDDGFASTPTPDWLENILQGEGAGTGTGGVDLGGGGDLLSLLQGAGGLMGGGSSSGLSSLLKGLGLTTGSGDMGSLLPLLSLLAGGGGLLNQNSKTNDAAAQLQAGADKANAFATDLIGGARGAFTPYQDAGASAVNQLSGMVGKNNLAGKFGPIGSNSDMASKFKGMMTLAQLAGK